MNNKFNVAIAISIIAFFIAALSLLLTYLNHQESRKIDFKWEANSDNSIMVKLERSLVYDEGKKKEKFDLPLWVEFKITNTGFRTFSVESIFLVVHIKDPALAGPAYMYLKTVDLKPNDVDDKTVSNEISFPLVFDPGHSKKFYKKIEIPITKRLYDAYYKYFKEDAFSMGDIYRLNSADTRMSNNFKIYAEIELAGGEKKKTRVYIDSNDSE